MKTRNLIFITIAAATATGCTATWVTKEIAVTKDANGNIIQTVETEKAEQRQSLWPFTFKHLKIEK